MIYPSNYPQPTWRYGQEITLYPERAQMECGWTRQRKTWPDTGSSISLEFIMQTNTFDEWIDWVYANGYQYFTIDLDRYGGVREAYDIRFVTPVQYSYESFDKVRVSVAGEFKVE
jgi:hypothetical protein